MKHLFSLTILSLLSAAAAHATTVTVQCPTLGEISAKAPDYVAVINGDSYWVRPGRPGLTYVQFYPGRVKDFSYGVFTKAEHCSAPSYK